MDYNAKKKMKDVFRQNLIELRKAQFPGKHSVRECSAAFGVTAQCWYFMERNSYPRAPRMRELEAFFGVEEGYFDVDRTSGSKQDDAAPEPPKPTAGAEIAAGIEAPAGKTAIIGIRFEGVIRVNTGTGEISTDGFQAFIRKGGGWNSPVG